MKILQKLEKAHKENRICWSFEYFPPKTEQGIENLYDRIDRMREFGPEFIDVTWGAGGSTAEATLEICANSSKYSGLETCMHLTCTNMPKEKIDNALAVCKQVGIQNILALRGDPPKGQERWTAIEGGFEHAIDLVKYIRKEHGDYFGIAVAGYPEGHVDCGNIDEDIQHLKEKVEARADFVVTQLFYDVDLFINWVKKCRDAGITCPIIPGIMPIHTYAGWKRIITLSKTIVPPQMEEDLEAIKDDDQAVKDYGVTFIINMVKKMVDAGFKDFHFYTLNLEKSVQLILEGLRWTPSVELVKPLPWKKSAGKRETETVRPIFWANRPRSYVERTQSWDDFPNGRWGDSRSPAFGTLDSWRSMKLKGEEARNTWGSPNSVNEIAEVFVKYIEGKLNSLPWCDSPLALESQGIKDGLIKLNRQGFLTINSQPSVNGFPSTHPVHGWGGSGGFVYQKAYLEFFISKEKFEVLKEKLKTKPMITYYFTSKDGSVETNCKSQGRPTALTWGVFPGSEIVQPTIIDLESFAVWKEEAFELWSQWASIYPEDSESKKVIENIRDNYLLVNLVDNDYVQETLYSLIDSLVVV